VAEGGWQHDVTVWCPPASHLSPPKEGTRSQSQSARFLWLRGLLIGPDKDSTIGPLADMSDTRVTRLGPSDDHQVETTSQFPMDVAR